MGFKLTLDNGFRSNECKRSYNSCNENIIGSSWQRRESRFPWLFDRLRNVFNFSDQKFGCAFFGHRRFRKNLKLKTHISRLAGDWWKYWQSQESCEGIAGTEIRLVKSSYKTLYSIYWKKEILELFSHYPIEKNKNLFTAPRLDGHISIDICSTTECFVML